MKRYITILFAIAQLNLLAQNSKFSASVSLSYIPTLCSNGAGDFGSLEHTYTPLLGFSINIEDMQLYFRSGERFELGFRSKNKYIFGGLGYVLDYNAPNNLRNSVFVEIGFPLKISEKVKVLISSRHGVTIKESLYFTSPINATLVFNLSK